MKTLFLWTAVGFLGACGGPQTVEEPSRENRTPVVALATSVEHRVAPNGQAEAALLVQGENAYVGTLTIEPGAGVPVHRDPTEEYIYVLEGTGTMVIDGQTYDVGPGTIVYMPANAEVSFTNGAERMVAVQIFAGPLPAQKYQKWTLKPAN